MSVQISCLEQISPDRWTASLSLFDCSNQSNSNIEQINCYANSKEEAETKLIESYRNLIGTRLDMLTKDSTRLEARKQELQLEIDTYEEDDTTLSENELGVVEDELKEIYNKMEKLQWL